MEVELASHGNSASLCRLEHPSASIRGVPINGAVTFSGLTLAAEPGQVCTVAARAVPQVSNLPQPRTFAMSMTQCPPGYEQLPGTPPAVLCHPCSQGLFNVNGDGVCRPCPSFGAFCAGSDDVLVAEHFWGQSLRDGSLIVARCPPQFCCSPKGDVVSGSSPTRVGPVWLVVP